MLNRLIKVIFYFTKGKANLYAASAVFMRGIVTSVMTTVHHTLMIFGMAAVTVIGILYFKPALTNEIKAFSPFTSAIAEETDFASPHLSNLMDVPAQPLTQSPSIDILTPRYGSNKFGNNSRQQQQLVSDWLSKRYRVAGDATYMLVSAAYLTADELKIDPLLILAVMAIESRFNPFAESPVGAQGLMQVMSKLHHEKFQELGGVKAALNPVANIKVGSVILKDYVARGGSVEAGLKLYVGAAAFDTDFGYGAKVLGEYRRLKEVSLGRKVPIFSTSASKSVPKPDALDSLNDEPKTLPPSENKSISTNQRTPPSKIMLVAEL